MRLPWFALPLIIRRVFLIDQAFVRGDNLDYWSADSTYTADNTGNLGDADDVWTSISGAFTPDSNPSTYGYNGNNQDVFTGIAVRNITQNANGAVSVDIRTMTMCADG